MKVQCGHCPAKYAVADERIRDKKVRIRCRRCNAAIVVDGKVSPPLVTSTPARPSVGPTSNAPGPESLPPSNPPPDHRPSPRPMAHTIMGGLEAPATHQLLQDHVGRVASARQEEDRAEDLLSGMPDPSRGFTDPPARGAADRWRVALTQQDLRWMTTEEITQAFKDGAVKLETFVFRAGMPTWVTLLEVSEIAQALADAQLVSPPLHSLRLEEDSGASNPEGRISSLPPPRKAARSRAAQPLAELAATAMDGATDSEESLPFALVPERAGSSKRASDEDAEVETVASGDDARDPVLAGSAPAGSAPAGSAPADSAPADSAPADSAPADSAPADSAPADSAPASPSPPVAASPALPAPPAGVGLPVESATAPTAATKSPDRSAAPVVNSPAKSGSGTWIWISVVVLLALAGAVFVLGPRFGLQLR